MKRYNTPHRSRVVKTRMTEEECSQKSYTSKPPGAARKAMSSPIRYGNPSDPAKSQQRKQIKLATNWPPAF